MWGEWAGEEGVGVGDGEVGGGGGVGGVRCASGADCGGETEWSRSR